MHRAGEPADAGHGAQQDARGAALPGVQALLPRQRRRVLRQLLRLLPARSLRADDRLVHREGSDHQRRDRPHAAVGDAVAVRAARRHHRRQRLVHLRPGLAGGVLRDDAAARARASASIATRSCASSSRSSTSATTTSSRAACSACAATSSRSSPSYEDTALRIELFGDEVDELHHVRSADRQDIRRHDKVAIYPKTHFVDVARSHTRLAVESIKAELDVVSHAARIRGQGARGAPPASAHDVRPRDDQGDRVLPRHRELLAAPDRARAGRAAADAARLPARRRADHRRREPPVGAAGPRDVSRRSVAQGSAGRLRLPAAVGARQPAAELRGVGGARQPAAVRVGDARARTSCAGQAAPSSSRSSGRPGWWIRRSTSARSRGQVDDLLGRDSRPGVAAASGCW